MHPLLHARSDSRGFGLAQQRHAVTAGKQRLRRGRPAFLALATAALALGIAANTAMLRVADAALHQPRARLALLSAKPAAAGIPVQWSRSGPREARPRKLALGLVAAVGFLLLVASAESARVLLVRARVPRREAALRLAWGTGRNRAWRELLIRGLLLAAAAGAVATTAWLPAETAAGPLRLHEAMASFAAMAIGTVGLLFAALPALSARRVRRGARVLEAAVVLILLGYLGMIMRGSAERPGMPGQRGGSALRVVACTGASFSTAPACLRRGSAAPIA